MIQQPMAFCWDDRGRLWVAENLDYETRGRGFSNAGNSRILILEDTDHDGVADSRKVFMEGIVFPSALAVGLRRRVRRRAAEPAVRARSGWRRQGRRGGHRSAPDRLGHPRSPRGAEQPALGAGRLAVRPAGIRDAVEGPKAGRQGPALQARRSRSPRTSSSGRRRRDQRRRLALPPDEGSVRGRRARLQQSRGASTTTPRDSCSSARA